MKILFKVLLLAFAAIGNIDPAFSQPGNPATPALQYARQGWTDDERQAFYTTSQGSRMIPYAWYKALRRLDVDEPFGGDQLQRYGYLPNERSTRNPEGLPVGRTATQSRACPVAKFSRKWAVSTECKVSTAGPR